MSVQSSRVKILAVIFFLLAGSETSLGTTVVLGVSAKRIVVAADSRATDPTSGRYHDDECKIITIHDLAFTMTGLFQEAAADSSVMWNGYEVSRRASQAVAATSALIDELPERWADEMVSILNRRPVAGWINDGFINQALFAGIAKTGELTVKLVRLTYDPATQRVNRSTDTLVLDPQNSSNQAVMYYTALGQADIAQEFVFQRTDRARTEADSWRLDMADKSDEERQWRKAARLVDLAAAYESNQKVGGEIDVIELTATGTHWWQRKETCRE